MDSVDFVDMGKRIRLLREENGLSQAQLAKRLDVGASFLAHMERGIRIASMETVVSIANALDTHLDYLLEGSLHEQAVETSPYLKGLNRSKRELLFDFFTMLFPVEKGE